MRESSRRQGTASPCAACKLLRRRCVQDCVFAPYFPGRELENFAIVHKVFGASNVNKMLQDLPVHQRSDAATSMVYEAKARVKDPVYGCVGTISSLQHQIRNLQNQLAMAQAEVSHLRMKEPFSASEATLSKNSIASRSSLPSISKLMTRSLLASDMMIDQTNFGESLWSC